MPDVVVYPIGGGVGLIGIWKALCELREIGWVSGPLPRFVIAQYEGCAPLVSAFEAGEDACQPWGAISTLPGGLRAPKPLADFLVLRILRETGGSAIAVSNEDALDGVRQVMEADGLFICPEAATAVVALRRLVEQGGLDAGQRIVVINTSSSSTPRCSRRPSAACPTAPTRSERCLPTPTPSKLPASSSRSREPGLSGHREHGLAAEMRHPDARRAISRAIQNDGGDKKAWWRRWKLHVARPPRCSGVMPARSPSSRTRLKG